MPGSRRGFNRLRASHVARSGLWPRGWNRRFLQFWKARPPEVRIKFVSESGIEHEVIFNSKPFGIEFQPNVPLTITRVMELGPANALGVRPGWKIKAINGKSLHSLEFQDVHDMLKRSSEHLPSESFADDTVQARRREQPALSEMIESFVKGGGPAHSNTAEGIRVGAILPDSVLPDSDAGGTDAWMVWLDQDGSQRGGALVLMPQEIRVPGACVFFIHGGAFEGGCSHDQATVALCSRLAQKTGVAVVCPDHLLSGPGRPFQAQQILEQLENDILWLLEYDPVTKNKRTSPAKIILAGDSSGGTQAMSLLLRLAQHQNSELLAAIRGCATISPWLDLSCGSPTYVSNAFAKEGLTGDVMFRDPAGQNRAVFRDCAVTYVGSEEELANPDFSPYWLSRGSLSEQHSLALKRLQEAQVPIWACIGAAETLSGEVLDFVARLEEELAIEVWLHEGAFHVWPLFNSSQPFQSKEVALSNLERFVRKSMEDKSFDLMDLVRGSKSSAALKGIHYYVDEWQASK